MKTIEAYTINEHPNPEACIEWVRNHWHDLADHYLEDMVCSIKAFASFHGVNADWALSVVPDRGEYVRGFQDVDFANKPRGDCPLTGMCYDHVLIDANSPEELENNILSALHADGEYAYSDENIRDMCEANDYHFFANGAIA